jgi:hypothetical protein
VPPGVAADRPGLRREHATDHDPAALDARADRLDAHARQLADSFARDRDRRIVADLRATAALLRRLAADLRILDRFLRDVDLLAPARAPD